MKSILIVIPAYNEERFISSVITGIRNAFNNADILVINDGSKDNTSKIASEAGAMVISHPYNLGYGAGLQTGFKYAASKDYEYVITMDADGQHSPESIPSLFQSMNETGADVVIGSRFLGGGYKMSFARRIGAWIFASIAKFYSGYRFTDPTSGFQLLNRQAFSCLSKEYSYPLDYPDVNIIMLLHKKRFKVVESPVRMFVNVEGDTMHSGLKPIMYIIKMFLAILMVLVRKED